MKLHFLKALCIWLNRKSIAIQIMGESLYEKDVLFSGYGACTYNPATGRLGVVAGLRLGVLLDRRLR